MRIEFDGGSVGKKTLVRLGMGAVRVALLFGSAAIAFALILTPVLDRRTRDMAAHGLDPIATGSVPGRVFVERRSVLQATPDAICIIHEDGRRSGTC
ncbi:hypothetical protein [Chelativorans sp. AA-79]|uniref:hypothetical protein n=1 Tax=Chelativorans sp. AA-79 TaxID=3028735 RepID=UPI0023F64226|nr:hypothetical protein [Chelativorans sp. AA-79]WEX09015.1 hypothetical protein PVE73_23705 [Chelativorans sp. AA-79]